MLEKASNGKNINVLDANVAKQCINHGPLDEITVYILPILLGNGTRLFEQVGLKYVILDKISEENYGDVTALRFK